jgi:hypothetical protein
MRSSVWAAFGLTIAAATVIKGSSNTAVSPSPAANGIAALYPGDVGIENDPDVVFVEKFEENTLADLFNRWTDILNGPTLSFNADVRREVPAHTRSTSRGSAAA